MKNTRCFKWTALLTAVIMVLGLGLSAVSAAEEGFIFSGEVYEQAPLDERFVDSAVITDSSDKEVPDLAAADPNNTFTLHLSVKEDKKANTNLDKLPENTDEAVMTYQLPNMTAENGENTVVSWTYDAAAKQLVFKWKNGKKTSFTADVSVSPAYPAATDRSGSYVLVTAGRVMLGGRNFKGDMITSSEVVFSGDAIRPWGDETPVWVLNHVSGDYYTMRSAATGRYLYISPDSRDGYAANRLYLVNADEATAQKILVTEVSGSWLTFTYKGSAINNFSSKAKEGFGSWKLSSKTNPQNNEKFRLYSPSSLVTEPSYDISGEGYLMANNQKGILSPDPLEGNANRLRVIRAWENNGQLIPADDVQTWTITHVIRDWYTVRTAEGYLNIDENGAHIGSEPQNLMAAYKENNKTFILKTSEFNENTDCRELSLISNNIDNGAGSTRYADNNDGRFTLAVNVAYAPVTLSGSYAITTDRTKAAAVAKDDGTGAKLVSVPYYMTDADEIYSNEEQIESWTFTKKEGNWYTVQARDGRYLKIADKKVTLSDTEAQVFIQEKDGLYRFTNGGNEALNNFHSNVRGGYGNYGNGRTTDLGEWMRLLATMSPDRNIVQFNMNGGDVTAQPNAVTGRAGDKVILPDVAISKNGSPFLGWYPETNFYAQVPGTNNSYRELYKAGTEYTVPAGIHTLYAVWGETNRKVQFTIRTDGIIQKEPGEFAQNLYTGQFDMEGALKNGYWVIDNDGTKPLADYYVNNNVVANLNFMPTADQVNAALQRKNAPFTFDPDTQYIHWYVLKRTPGGEWHVDGIIRDKAAITISYVVNVPSEEQTNVTDVASSYQVAEGEEVVAGAAKDSEEASVPQREGYTFVEWNTEQDGSGTAYKAGDAITMDQNVTLYAQWDDILTVEIESNVAGYEKVYAGTVIELTAVRGGTYTGPVTYQWEQVDPDTGEEEIIPGATEEKYTFTINAENAKYLYHVTLTPVDQK